jgi:hypothetical protein
MLRVSARMCVDDIDRMGGWSGRDWYIEVCNIRICEWITWGICFWAGTPGSGEMREFLVSCPGYMLILVVLKVVWPCAPCPFMLCRAFRAD